MRRIDLIVIHCSATREDRPFTEQDLETAHRLRGFDGIGYHFYVRRNGDIKSTRLVERVGAHVRGHNANSIGICYEGGLGHRDLSPDVNGNGEVEPMEWTKACPCFEAKNERW